MGLKRLFRSEEDVANTEHMGCAFGALGYEQSAMCREQTWETGGFVMNILNRPCTACNSRWVSAS